MPNARLFAVPRWTERAVLLALGAWLLAFSAARLLEAVNTAGGMLLPAIPAGDNGWVPARPLGQMPFRIEARLSILTPLALVAFVAYGAACWSDAAKRRRFLVAFAFADALLVVMAYQGLTFGTARTNFEAYALHQFTVAPVVAIAIVMAWPSRAARWLTLGGAAILAGCYATVYALDGGIPADHWLSDPTRFTAFWLARAFLMALAPALIGAALCLASRPRAPSPAAPSSAPA